MRRCITVLLGTAAFLGLMGSNAWGHLSLWEYTTFPGLVEDVQTGGFDFLNLGVEFSLAQEGYVDSLGFYDHLDDGFDHPVEVGIFSEVGDLLVTAVLPAGTGATLHDGFRFADITPYHLEAGTTYILAGVIEDTDVYRYTSSSSDYVFSPDATQESDGLFLYSNAGGLQEPTNVGEFLIYGGPNLTFVPEPSTVLLALLGIGLLVRPSRRR